MDLAADTALWAACPPHFPGRISAMFAAGGLPNNRRFILSVPGLDCHLVDLPGYRQMGVKIDEINAPFQVSCRSGWIGFRKRVCHRPTNTAYPMRPAR